MPATGAGIGTPASIKASDDPHTVAIDDEPFAAAPAGVERDFFEQLFHVGLP